VKYMPVILPDAAKASNNTCESRVVDLGRERHPRLIAEDSLFFNSRDPDKFNEKKKFATEYSDVYHSCIKIPRE